MEEVIAEVLINRPSKRLNRTFSYRIPSYMQELTAGWRCVIPFGGKKEEGIILSVRKEETKHLTYKLLDIEGAVDAFPWFTDGMLETARSLSSYYMCTMLDALRLFLIDKNGIRKEVEYRICWENIGENDSVRNYIDESVSVLTEEDGRRLFGKELEKYVEDRRLEKREEILSRYKQPLEKWIAITPLSEEKKNIRSAKQRLLLNLLEEKRELSWGELRQVGFSSSVIQSFCDNGGGKIIYKNKPTFSLVADTISEEMYELTEEQEEALRRITETMNQQSCKGILLKGVTGSGKTEVYLRAAIHALHQGGMALILVPEIALTAQMSDYFSRRLGEEVVFVHSKLNKTERYNNRMRIMNGESHVVIGSRSALFMPFSDLKVIIVDEEYDTSYKQEETPRYNGRDVAKMMSAIYDCSVVLGAATPSVVTYHAAMQGKIELVEMKERVHGRPLPKVYIADMREEVDAGNSGLFSRALLDLLTETFRQKQKAILLLNRRGYATTLLCSECGHIFKCPHCDVPLVYHRDSRRVRCHYCEWSHTVPHICPQCGSESILYLGRGTQKIEDEMAEYYPDIPYERFDLDSTSAKNSANRILSAFREGLFSVLFGTQMVAKGHDIPGVKTVGILNVDSALNFPSYLSAEHTFNLIVQCAGRAGRDGESGNVILQTYNPDHYAIRWAAKQNYEAFYAQEIEYRKELGYPPFSHMMKITCRGKEENLVHKQAHRVYGWLKKETDGRTVICTPPYEEFVKKVRDTYYVSVLIKGKSLAALKQRIRQSPIFRENGIIINIDPM